MSDVMIEARELSKQYPGAARPVTAVDKVSFEIRRGEVTGFLGPNGAGKTTTMKILTCFIAPTAGTARVNGADVWEDPTAVRTAIGYLPESTPLYTEMMVYEYLQWAARMRGLKGERASHRLKIAVEQTGLGDVIAKEIRALSKGYRQRVGLAQALMHEPPILILDEPLSGLDPNQAVEIRDLIKAIGKERTVILSTHNLAEVQATCNRVLIIANGRIVADDTPAGLSERTGRRRYVTSVLNGDGGKVREVLGRIPGVDRVKPLTGAGDELRFELVPTKDQDLRPEIFRAAVDGGFVLVELRSEGQNLENIFRDLTTGDAPEPKRAKPKKKVTSEPPAEAESAPEEEPEEEQEAKAASDEPAEEPEAEEPEADEAKADEKKQEGA